MKRNYYVSKVAQSSSGDHEVHDQTCEYLPASEHRVFLGEFESCREAVSTAKRIYYNADGCRFCSPECHKR